MREYGTHLYDLEEHWTDAQLIMFVERIGERYQRQAESEGEPKQGHDEVSDAEFYAMLGNTPNTGGKDGNSGD